MDIKTQIADKQAEIKKEISYLLWAVEKRLSARVNDADEHSGFKYPFSLKFDELPFFSLYVNLKKATYEHLLVLSHQANDLNDLDYSDLAKVGVTVEKGNLHFKGMKDFATKRVPFTDLDLLALEEYLNEIEASLLYSLFTDPVQAIYIKLQTNSCSENQNVDSEGRIVGGLQEDESGIDMDDLEILKTENNWSVFTSHNEMEDEDETEVRIDVSASKAAFCPRQNKKPMNLGSAFDRPAKPRKATENDLSGTFVMPTFEKTFEPGNNGKPRDLSIRRKAKPVQQAPASAEAQETLSEAVTIDVKKPDFVPNVKLNATPKQVSFEKPDRPNQKRYASASETLQKPKSETKDTQEDPVCLVRASPDVFESRTILNDPSLHFVHSVFEARWRRILTTPEGLLKSPRSFYLGTDEKDPAIANFSPDEWNILAANVDGDNEPYAYLLSSKSERGCCMAVLRKEKSLVLLCLSRKGIGTENPPHSYEEVLSICLGKQE